MVEKSGPPFRISCCVCRSAVEATRSPSCSSCGLSNVTFRYPDLVPSLLGALEVPGEGFSRGMWRFRRILPVGESVDPVDMGEGSTPLVSAARVVSDLRSQPIHLKLESINPSGTFKDRCASVALTKAVEFGADAVAIASAGNAGAAAAAYAARADLRCYVVVPATTPDERLIQTQLYGACVIKIADATVNDCAELVRRGANRYGWYPVTTAATENPYQAEATRTIAYEVVEQLGGRAPDWVIVPVGGGGLLSGVARGFRDLSTAAVISSSPRLGAIQPEGCAPLVRAINEGQDPDGIQPWGPPTSLATSIADPFPMDGYRASRFVTESRGVAVAVSDEDIVEAERRLAETEGIFVEPASATALAGLRQLLYQETIGSEDVVVVVATGSGFKDLAVARSLVRPVPVIAPLADAMFTTVDRWLEP